MLPADILNESTAVRGLSSFLEHLLGELCLKGRVQAGAMGASITVGHGLTKSSQQFVWPDLLQNALSAIWNASVTVRNAAAAATSADFGALCYDSLLPEPVTVNFIEYGHTTKDARLFEPLLQQTLARQTLPFIVDYVHMAKPLTFHSCHLHLPPNGTQLRRGFTRDGRPCNMVSVMPHAIQRLAEINRLFKQYDLPMVSMQPVARWMYKHGKASGLSYFVARDGRHATVHTHRLLAFMVANFLFKAHQQLATTPPKLRNATLPRKKARSLDQEASICVFGQQLKEQVHTPSADWQFVVQNDKAGFLTTTPGSTLEVQFNSTYTNSTLYLGYLKSYEHMGKVQVTCHTGCTCWPLKLDAHTASHHSLHSVSRGIMLNASRTETRQPCLVRLRVCNETSSDGHKFKLSSLTLASKRLAGRMRPSKVMHLQAQLSTLKAA